MGRRPKTISRHILATARANFQMANAHYRRRQIGTVFCLPLGSKPRDFLLGGVMCTTSRWFVFGETGIGKTLLFMDLGAAVAAAMAFLNWPGQRRARVMYLDGELPLETFKERMQLIAARYGDDIQFYGYNREDLGDDRLPPLNTEQGQNWLRREIDAIKPDLIIFDSIFCLLVGSAKEEDTWAPVKTLVRELTRRHISRIWLNQANEIGKSFGDKTREWEMDTVVKLSRPIDEGGEPDDTAIRWEFRTAMGGARAHRSRTSAASISRPMTGSRPALKRARASTESLSVRLRSMPSVMNLSRAVSSTSTKNGTLPARLAPCSVRPRPTY
jgi:AAA domain